MSSLNPDDTISTEKAIKGNSHARYASLSCVAAVFANLQKKEEKTMLSLPVRALSYRDFLVSNRL